MPWIVPVFVVIGLCIGATGPSRDLIVRNATPKGAAGRVYGFVYSGLDLGAMLGPVWFGMMLDHGLAREDVLRRSAVLFVVAIGTVVQVRRAGRAAGAESGESTDGSRHRGPPRAGLRGEQGTGPRLRRGARARRRGRHDLSRAPKTTLRATAARDRRTRRRPVAGSRATSRRRRAARRRSRACPQPDILVNNAGGPPPGDFRDWDRDAWMRALDANMLTPIELIKATVDAMIERRFGRIVNITSSCGEGADRHPRAVQRRALAA